MRTTAKDDKIGTSRLGIAPPANPAAVLSRL
jgi:hypothetical protein